MNTTDRVTGGARFSSRRFAAVLGAMLLGGAACWAQTPPVEGPEAAPAPGKKILVADIIPQGLHNVPPQRVMGILKTRVGSEYSQSLLEEDVRKLYETKSFANIQVQQQRNAEGNVVVFFQFRELPNLVQEIVYHGAKHVKPDDLNTAAGLRKGMPLNPIANQQACQKILQYYYEKARLLASVDLVEGGQPSDTRVVFNITEGPIARISSIEFEGDTFVTKARLRTQINSSAQFLGLPLGGKLNPMMLENDVSKLEEYFRRFGYHDVRVSRELQWSPDQQHVKVVFHVHQGERYRVHGVDVEGTATASREQLIGLTKVKTGEYINEDVSKADAERIKAYFGYRGNDAQVIQNVVYQPDKPEAVIQYQVKEQTPTTVGQILIIGNDVTKDNVIRRQIPLYPGQVLTYPDLRRAEANLARLQIFEVKPEQGIRPTVSVIEPPDPESPVRDVLVQVQETATGSLMFGLGVNSDAGFTGSIVLNERNFDITNPPTSLDELLSGHAFRGAGQEFRVEAVPGTQLQRYTVSFREPFLFDSPYSLGVSGYYYDRVFNEYTESRLGTRITLGRKLSPLWSASVGLRIEDVGVHDVVFFAPPDFQDVVGDNFLVGFRAGVTRDSRDSYLRPTEGSLLDIGFEEVTGDYTFPVFTVEANKYWTVFQRPDQSGRHVLAYHGELALTNSNTPVFERFYAGGFRSMRGFEFRGVGPDVNGFKVGGDFMFLNSLEYQLPVRANDQIYFVGFVDSGTVERTISLDNYRVSAGAGVRIVVPLLGPVPIALDFGFPIVKAPEDRTQVFSFWVGFFH